MATKMSAQPVTLKQLWARVGGDLPRVKRLVEKAGGKIEVAWDGEEATDAGTAAKVVREHDKMRAESEARDRGFKRYVEEHARERQRIHSEAFNAAYREQVRQQRAESRDNQFVSGTWNLSLDPRRYRVASREAADKAEAWAAANPLLSDIEWAERHKKEWRLS